MAVSEITVKGKPYTVYTGDVFVWKKLELDGTAYPVPAPVAQLIKNMAAELEEMREKTAVTEEELSQRIQKKAASIAYRLSGGSNGEYGTNFLSLPLNSPSLNPDSDGEFYNDVVNRIVACITGD